MPTSRSATLNSRSRRSSGPRDFGAGSIRWDRLGRIALLIVLVVILLLYIGPARAYFSAAGESNAKKAELSQLQKQNADLKRQRARLRNPAALEREARRLGMVRPGEQPYVIERRQ